MALFTDKRELARQAERVPMDTAQGWRKVALAALGYKGTGEKNEFGKAMSYLPAVGFGTLTNLGARAVAKDGKDYNEVIKRGTGDELTTDVQKLDFAWQAFKIYLAAGGNVGGGSAQAAGSAPTAATDTATGLGTGGEVLTGGADALGGTAVQGIDATAGGLAQATEGANYISEAAGITSLADEMAAVGSAMTAPQLNVANFNANYGVDPSAVIPDSVGEADPTLKQKFVDYLNTAYDDVGPSDSQVTPSGERYNIVTETTGKGLDVMGRKGSGSGSGVGSNLFSKDDKEGILSALSDENKKKLNRGIKSGIAKATAERGKNQEDDYNIWKAEVEKNGYRVVGYEARDNMGNVVSKYEEPDESAKNQQRTMSGLKSMATGNIVSSGVAYVGGAIETNRDYEDRADEYRNQGSLNTSYLL